MSRVVVDVPALYRLWSNYSLTKPEVARQLGVTRTTLEWLSKKHKLPRRPTMRKKCRVVDPTPEEIAERSRECREAHLAAMRAAGPDPGRVAAAKVRRRQRRGVA